jgi:phytol kinase
MTLADTLKVLLVLALAGGLIAVLRLYQLRGRPPPGPEFVRKLFHIGGGIIGLSLPWLFDSLVPVLVLAGTITSTFAAMRFVRQLRSGVGQVLLGVDRRTVGEFCYIASLALLFWLSHGDKLLYSVPLLILALADAFAALVGEEYGKLPLHMWQERKSYEGVAAFILTAYFCVHVPVLLWGDTGRLESLLIAFDVSVMVMMAEVAAWWGLDNLIIPVWGYMLLKSLLRMDAIELASHLAFLLALALFMRFWRNRTTLGDDALFGATLWGYVVWAVGGWRWVVPPLIQLVIYATITVKTPLDPQRMFRFPVVLANISGSIFWLLAYRQSDEPALLLPFAACFASNVAIIALVRHKLVAPDLAWRQAVSANVAKGMLVMVPSVLALDRFTISTLLDLAAGLIAVYAATAIFYRLQPGLTTFPVDAGRWTRQALVVAATSVLALGIHHSAMPDPTSLGVTDLLNLLEH